MLMVSLARDASALGSIKVKVEVEGSGPDGRILFIKNQDNLATEQFGDTFF